MDAATVLRRVLANALNAFSVVPLNTPPVPFLPPRQFFSSHSNLVEIVNFSSLFVECNNSKGEGDR